MSERLDKLEKIVTDLALSQAKTDGHIRENSRDIKALKESQAKTDEQLGRLTERVDKMSEKVDILSDSVKSNSEDIKKLSEEYGRFTNNQGEIIEILFYNALKEELVFDGIKYDGVSLNLEKKAKKVEQEFDIVLTNGYSVALIEVKGKAYPNNLSQLDDIVENYRFLFPEHKNYRIASYLGSMHISKAVKNKVKETNHKLVLLKGSELVVLQNRRKNYICKIEN